MERLQRCKASISMGGMTKTLAVEITTKPSKSGKSWIARLTGFDDDYGFARDFLSGREGRKNNYIAQATKPGVYECSDDSFAVLSADGTVEWVGKDRATELVSQIGAPTGRDEALTQIRALMAEHGITADEI